MTSPQDWFDQLPENQKPVLQHLRQLILQANPHFRKELK